MEKVSYDVLYNNTKTGFQNDIQIKDRNANQRRLFESQLSPSSKLDQCLGHCHRQQMIAIGQVNLLPETK